MASILSTNSLYAGEGKCAAHFCAFLRVFFEGRLAHSPPPVYFDLCRHLWIFFLIAPRGLGKLAGLLEFCDCTLAKEDHCQDFPPIKI